MSIARWWVAVLLVAVTPLSQAATYTWTGAAGAFWSNPSNWSPAGVPANGDTLVFGFVSGRPIPPPPVVNDIVGLSVAEIRVEHDYTLHGNEVAVTGAITAPGGSGVLVLPVHFSGATATLSATGLTGSLELTGSMRGTAVVTIPGKTVRFRGTHAFAGAFQQGAINLVDGATMPNATIEAGLMGTGRVGNVAISGRLLWPGTASALGAIESGNLYLDSSPVAITLAQANATNTPDEIVVNGSVVLNNPTLSLTTINTFRVNVGDVFTIIDNDGSDAVIGSFSGLPEGATVNAGPNHSFRISYVGGDGNDVTLTVLTTAASGPSVDIFPATVTAANQSAFTLRGTCSEYNRIVTIDVVGGPSGSATCGIPFENEYTSNALDLSAFPDGPITVNARHETFDGQVATAQRVLTKEALGTGTWLGGSSSNWSNPANWSGNELPAANGVAIFAAETTSFNITNDVPGLTVSRLDFRKAYHLVGQTITVTNAIVTATGGATIDAPLHFGDNIVTISTVNATDLILGGEVTGTGQIRPLNGVIFSGDNRFSGQIRGVALLGFARLPSASFFGTMLAGIGTIGSTSISAGALIPGIEGAGRLETGSLILQGALLIDFYGMVPGVSHDEVRVTGTVTLDGAVLQLATGPNFKPVVGQVFTILANDYTDAVSGIFDGLPEGAIVTIDSHQLRVSYAGGDGNDVTLTSVNGGAVVTPQVAITSAPTITDGNAATYTVHGTCNLPAQPVYVTVGGLAAAAPAVCQGTTFNSGAIDVRSLANGPVTVVAVHRVEGVVEGSHTVTVLREPKLAQVIGFPQVFDRSYDMGNLNLTITGGASGNPVILTNVTPTVCTISPSGQLTIHRAGECILDADQAGNAYYDAAPTVRRTFQVTRAAQPLAFHDPITVSVLEAGSFPLHALGPSSGTTTYASLTPGICTNNGNQVTPLAVGTCTIQASNPGDDRYLAATATTSITITTTLFAAVTFNSDFMEFAPQSLNTASIESTVRATNHGTAPFTISAAEVSGPFSITHDCVAVAPQASCNIRGTFRPTAEGVVVGGVILRHNAAGGSSSLRLEGTGVKSLVSHFYFAVLGRGADFNGYNYWNAEVARLQALGANLNEAWFAMALTFFNTPEYRALAASDTDYLHDLYFTFFNRAPDSGGLAYWASLLQQGLTRENVLQAFLFSAEFDGFTRALFGDQDARAEAEMLMDFYRGTLARLPDSAGFNYWLGRLRAAQCAGAAAVASEANTITQLFLTSPEYSARARTNAEYVSDLYNTFMRRGGDLPGQQHWVSQLAAGTTRDTVRAAFIASPEFQARVQAVVGAGCLK